MGAADVVGSPASVLDLGTLQVADEAVSFAVLTDPMTARTRLAVEMIRR